VVSLGTSNVPAAPAKRSRVERKCSDKISGSFTRSLEKNGYASLVFAQSWHARGML
jgi:hypothetical protein